MPTGASPSGSITCSTLVYSISMCEANYMQGEASSFWAAADGSHDLFLMWRGCAIFLWGPPGLEYWLPSGQKRFVQCYHCSSDLWWFHQVVYLLSTYLTEAVVINLLPVYDFIGSCVLKLVCTFFFFLFNPLPTEQIKWSEGAFPQQQ